MFTALIFMLGLGGVCGIMLSVASKMFYVYEDPRIAIVEGFTAAANCGGCGYTGCSAAAVAVVSGAAPPSVCIVAGPESAANIAAVMGVDPGTAEPLISYNTCSGGDRAETKYHYMGIGTCQALATLYGGQRECPIGCLGLGDCVRACAFDALKIGPHGYPVVNEHKCVGCGACEKTCPKDIMAIKTMSQRLLHLNQDDNRIAPCQQTCPAEIDIPRYIMQIKHGDYEGAVNTIRERNPLLLACGRVCPHPCETKCRRGIEDQPVSINQLKRFVADYEMNSGKHLPISVAPSTGKKVAVIGGGPAGLSCAFFLRRLGHSVTIFDATPKLGGMIRYGIPEYRLPKEVLAWEVQGILDLGIEHKPNVRLGRDFDTGSLIAAGYDAIFLGIGAWKDYNLGVEGETLKGCYTGISFLTNFALWQQERPKDPRPFVGKKCVVIGGGNTAIDCVRTLVRLGADEVSIVYRRTRKEMPANAVEIVAAEHEGINFVFLAAPTKVIGNEDGNVVGLEYLKMELGEPDASGRRRPVPVEGSETVIDVDMLITAIGQGPDVFFKEESKMLDEDLKITRWNTIDAKDPVALQSSIPYIFTGGDSATGAALVVDAIGAGRRAARSIHMYIAGEDLTPPANTLFKKNIPESIVKSVPGIIQKKRTPMPELPVDERIKSFIEADLVITEEDAIYESNRCLNCCIYCYNPDTT
ncbi:MAG: FAD-dependent oxidoreductase [Desulfobacterales bacterium]|uniref:Ion-translocating oxidoreductase complex subunit B n=1 Tax=Candidatus Desulfatibia profunda TaxID=2841695 RepID=A0A8J6TLB7_9BACT|nr:FAD-dependent oxidoreductase [Candidatus Desulfatibia profunda]MBL7178726.1 FAD-dependent oxidoreductase [Desulfobacterales bacterium]